MFIGHLPAGYLATRLLLRGRDVTRTTRRLMALGVAASVLPDLDLLWFFLVDHRRQVHHAYLPHKPFAWLAALAVAAGVMRLMRARPPAWTALAVVGVNVMLHLVLDTTAGGIRWLWPWTEAEFAISQPVARYDPWYLNFVLHWSFAMEMALVTAALWIWLRRREVPA